MLVWAPVQKIFVLHLVSLSHSPLHALSNSPPNKRLGTFLCALNAASKAKVNAGDCIPIENAATGKFGLFRVEMLELL